MIEVILTKHGERQSCVFDIETPEDAVFVARTLWDDYTRENMLQGVTKGLALTFLVDGKCVRVVERYRP